MSAQLLTCCQPASSSPVSQHMTGSSSFIGVTQWHAPHERYSLANCSDFRVHLFRARPTTRNVQHCCRTATLDFPAGRHPLLLQLYPCCNTKQAVSSAFSCNSHFSPAAVHTRTASHLGSNSWKAMPVMMPATMAMMLQDTNHTAHITH
jgi:hypothetical protein